MRFNNTFGREGQTIFMPFCAGLPIGNKQILLA